MSSLLKNSESFLIAEPVLPKYFWNMSITFCLLKLEQYDAYFMVCHVTSLPESSSLFSMITRLPYLSNASKSKRSLVFSNPANSFCMISKSFSREDGSFAIHSCKS